MVNSLRWMTAALIPPQCFPYSSGVHGVFSKKQIKCSLTDCKGNAPAILHEEYPSSSWIAAIDHYLHSLEVVIWMILLCRIYQQHCHYFGGDPITLKFSANLLIIDQQLLISNRCLHLWVWPEKSFIVNLHLFAWTWMQKEQNRFTSTCKERWEIQW